jgi:hypothetical protein
VAGQGLFFSGSYLYDPIPPIVNNYYYTDIISSKWQSVVFHLPQGANRAVYCAKMIPADIPTSPSMKPTVEPTVRPVVVPTVQPHTSEPTKVPSVFYGIEFTSHIKPAEARGAVGTYNMSITVNSVGSYSWHLDLTNYQIPPNFVEGGCTIDYVKAHGLQCKWTVKISY